MIRPTDSTHPNPPLKGYPKALAATPAMKGAKPQAALKMPSSKSGIDKLLQRDVHPNPYF